MKKTEYHFKDACETDVLYVGIPEIYGEFLLTTNGNPITLNDLEDVNNEEADSLISEIMGIISDTSTPWEACGDEDEEYVSGWLEAWGIA